MTQNTACPLDCYDACSVIVTEGKLKGDPEHPYTHGYLCPHLNHFRKQERITQPRLHGEAVSMEVAMEHLETLLKSSETTLHYRGGGNFGLMQGVTDHFFAERGATLTNGSLCDGAGEAGILAGRGVNHVLPPEQIAASEVVILWGRNVHTTNAHLLPFLKGKTVIVIDPIRTKMADRADLYLPIKPAGDLYFAMLLARFIIIERMEDAAYLAQFGSDFEEYYELTQTIRIKAALDQIGMTLGDIGRVMEQIRGKRTVILTGAGIQKYRHGAEVQRAIDAIGVLLGLFGKAGCGVGYLGSSGANIISPFTRAKRFVSKVTTPFSDFETVFIQGANPAAQMPDSARVADSLGKAGHVIYFGLYENETSALAELVIPAKTFLEKWDVRTSYGHNAMLEMPACEPGEVGIGEYDLAARLCCTFDIALRSEAEYLEHFRAQSVSGGSCRTVSDRQPLPYHDGFDTSDGAFVFLDEVDLDMDLEDDYFLLTPKSARSLNSQFGRESRVFMHPSCGFAEGEVVQISSAAGAVELPLAFDDRLRADCVLIYAGTAGVNRLTPSLISHEGHNAVFQQLKVTVTPSPRP